MRNGDAGAAIFFSVFVQNLSWLFGSTVILWLVDYVAGTNILAAGFLWWAGCDIAIAAILGVVAVVRA